MRYLGPTSNARLNEACAVVFLFVGLFLLVGLASYQPFDSSMNTVASAIKPANLTGRAGAYLADFFLQTFGIAAYAIPTLILLVGWKWIQSVPIHAPIARTLGATLMLASTCALLGFPPNWHPIAGIIPGGGLVGLVLADELVASMNLTGAVMFAVTCWIVGLYLVSKFEMALLQGWLGRIFGSWIGRPFARMFSGFRSLFRRIGEGLVAWREKRALAAKARAEKRALRTAMKAREPEASPQPNTTALEIDPQPRPSVWKKSAAAKAASPAPFVSDAPPFDPTEPLAEETPAALEDIPIRMLEYPPSESQEALVEPPPAEPVNSRQATESAPRRRMSPFRVPSTELLTEAPPRTKFDNDELRDTAAQIKSKFEEFNVRGSVTQINPGPVVTTFEFKPEAGVKYCAHHHADAKICASACKPNPF